MNWDQGMWVTSCTRSVGRGFGNLEKVSELSSYLRTREFHSDLGEARRICALREPRVGWVESWRCKSSHHRKIVCVSLSPHVEKPLNSKRWIKVSYLNQFRECCVFRIPYVSFTHPYIMGILHFLERYEPPYPPAVGQTVALLFFYRDKLWY